MLCAAGLPKREVGEGLGVANCRLDEYSPLHSLFQCAVAKGGQRSKSVFTLHNTARVSKRSDGSLQ